MSHTSHIGHYVRVPTAGGFDAEHPLSVSDVQYMGNNAKHLRDEFTQHRVNWALPDDSQPDFYGMTSAGDWAHAMTHIIPWTITPRGYPTSAVIRITGIAEEVLHTFAVAAVLSADRDKVSWTHDQSSHLIYRLATTIIEDPAAPGVLIQECFDLNNDTARAMMQIGGLKTFSVYDRNEADDVIAQSVGVFLLRFTVWVLGLGYMTHVSLREYTAYE